MGRIWYAFAHGIQIPPGGFCDTTFRGQDVQFEQLSLACVRRKALRRWAKRRVATRKVFDGSAETRHLQMYTVALLLENVGPVKKLCSGD